MIGMPRNVAYQEKGSSEAEIDAAHDLAAGKGDHRGIHERKADCHARELVHPELLGGGVRQNDRQEIEHAVGDGVQNGVSAIVGELRDELSDGGKDALHDTGGREGAEHGGEDTRDEVNGLGGNSLGCVVLGVDLPARDKTAHSDDGIVYVLNLIAHHDLVLAVGLHDLDYALELLDGLGVSLALVLELEAHAGDAMRDAVDVLLAAHILKNGAREVVVLSCHVSVLSLQRI